MDFSNFDLNKIITTAALSVVPFLFAVTVHELMHGFVAYKLGDDTAKSMGRLTLNPLKHIDPLGLLFLLVTRMFGWAKPVPVNFNNIRHHKYGVALVSLAGPLSNLTLALLSVLAFKLFVYIDTIEQIPIFLFKPLLLMVQYSIAINVSLFVFNLLPIMPFDGARIISNFLPRDMAMKYEMTDRYGMLIILFLFITGAMEYIIRPPMMFVYSMLLKI